MSVRSLCCDKLFHPINYFREDLKTFPNPNTHRLIKKATKVRDLTAHHSEITSEERLFVTDVSLCKAIKSENSARKRRAFQSINTSKVKSASNQFPKEGKV
ncbi:hypothetical protein NPIL_205381 [Nephila pilipes]|uniref:Uncharacterized protein n=1 Tax=Nephila pilipes TaxID=299642 RepID=A0A8X6I3Q8_NEPPI|nr:hypothetical protein NPIL_205381 [Nephila pilipes]